VIPIALALAVLDFATLHWTAKTLPTALAALVVWGISGWGLLVAQQHRLVAIAPSAAPILIGLNSSALYLAVSAAGLIGAGVISVLGAGWLGAVGAAFLGAALLATRLPIRPVRGAGPDQDRLPAEAGTGAVPASGAVR
jgi:predicted MFS family arabinose efflux permease